MSVGLPVDKNILDARAGNLAWELREKLDEVRTVKAWLDGKPDEELEAAPFNYSPTEVATLKSAFTDLDKLARIANGEADQDEANDFFFWADRLTGLQ